MVIGRRFAPCSMVRSSVAFDSLALATVNRPDSELADELRAFGIRFSAIGDRLAPRHAAAAIFAGRRVGLVLSGGY